MLRLVMSAALAAVLCVGSQGAFASPASELRQKIASYQDLSAEFTQKVVSPESPGRVLATSSGKLYLKKPKSFLMHTVQPDDTKLFTRPDGIYFLDGFMGQLNIYSLDRINDQPFALLYSSDEGVWSRYGVKLEGGSYVLTPKKVETIKSVELKFSGDKISQITLNMTDGNVNTYTLSNVSQGVPDSVFDVKIPQGTEINDER